MHKEEEEEEEARRVLKLKRYLLTATLLYSILRLYIVRAKF